MHLARRLVVVISAAMIAGSVLPAFAQQKKLGLVVGYPASVGVEWRPNDRFSLRGDGTMRWSSTEQDQTPTSSGLTGSLGSVVESALYSVRGHYKSTTTAGTIGVAAIINVSKADRFRTYLAPRIAWSMSKTTANVTYEFAGIPPPFADLSRLFTPQTLETTERTPTVSVVGGATVEVHERCNIFAEAGAGYTWGTLSSPVVGAITAPATHTRTVALRSGVGATIYF